MSILRVCVFAALAMAVLSVGVFSLHRSASASLAPSKPIAKSIEAGMVSLDWDDVPGATGYELRYRDTEWNVLPHDDVNVTLEGSSAVIRSLPGGSEYAFSVRTRAPGGYRSNWSEPVYPTLLPVRALPAQPGNLKVVKRERNSVKLEWHGVNSADSYQVAYWRTSEEGEDWVILPDEGIHVSFDTISGPGAVVSRLPDQPEKMHDFAVRAVNAEGVSSWSEVVQAPAFLQVPQDLIGWYQAPGQVVLAWHEVPAANAYEILFWYDLQTVSEEWVVLPTDGIAVSLDGSQALVDLGSDYSDRLLNFSVRAINDLSKSPWSSIVAVGPVLQIPAELTGRLLEDGSITLNWLDVPIVDAYEVRFLLGGVSGSQWVTLPAEGIEVSFDGSGARLEQLPDYASYALQVRATKEYSLPSDWSEEFTIARQTSVLAATVQTTPGGSPPAGPSTASTEPPEDSGAPPQANPVVTGTQTPASTSEPVARSRDRSSSSPRSVPALHPRVWLSPNPSILKKYDWKKFVVKSADIAAAREIVASIGINYTKKGEKALAFSFSKDGNPKEACVKARDFSSLQENFFNQGVGNFTFYVTGCNVGKTKISLDVSRFTGSADSISQHWGDEYPVTVEEAGN